MNRTMTPGKCTQCDCDLPIPRFGQRRYCTACVTCRPRTRKAKVSYKDFEADWLAGVPVTEIAKRLGCTYKTVTSAVKRADAPRRERTWNAAPEVKAAKIERARQMIESYKAGLTLERIGVIHGITRERVRQVLAKNGLTASDGGLHVKAAINQKRLADARRSRMEARAQRVYGCTYDQLIAIAQTRKVRSSKVVRAYVSQKINASKRGIGFEMTLPEWWAIWQASGKWAQRGRGKGYCMARKGDEGPYAVGNVYICTIGQNFSDSYIKTPMHVRVAKRAQNGNGAGSLGRGRGWSFVARQTGRPYHVMCGKKYVGSYATEAEARSAYLEACRIRRDELIARAVSA